MVKEKPELDEELLALIEQAGHSTSLDGRDADRARASKILATLLAYNYQSTKLLAESSEKLVKGSDRLEKLTWALIILTIILLLFESKLFG